MIVCHCAVVNCRTIGDAVDDGATTLSRVCASTGAGQQCGTCVFAIKRVITERAGSRARALATHLPAASGDELEQPA